MLQSQVNELKNHNENIRKWYQSPSFVYNMQEQQKLGQRQGAGVIDEYLPQGIHNENSPVNNNTGEGTFGNVQLL